MIGKKVYSFLHDPSSVDMAITAVMETRRAITIKTQLKDALGENRIVRLLPNLRLDGSSCTHVTAIVHKAAENMLAAAEVGT